MRFDFRALTWSGLAFSMLLATTASLDAGGDTRLPNHSTTANQNTKSALRADIPLEALPPKARETVLKIVTKPTLFTHGPAELFQGNLSLYNWFLDHPDQAVRAWRKLGARCMDIRDQGAGRFGWSDGQGTEIHWDTVLRGREIRVWLAEGSARVSPLLPAVPVRAVVVLRYVPDHEHGLDLIHHQADLYMQTDSKTAALFARLLGASAPRLAEQCVAQLEMFFSALVWYFDRHPGRLEALFSDLAPLPSHLRSPAEFSSSFSQLLIKKDTRD
jgi:hypothetical protein